MSRWIDLQPAASNVVLADSSDNPPAIGVVIDCLELKSDFYLVVNQTSSSASYINVYLQGSPDGINWHGLGNTSISNPTNSGTSQLWAYQYSGIPSRYLQLYGSLGSGAPHGSITVTSAFVSAR